MFKNFEIECEKGVASLVKQMFTINTLIENECMEAKVRTRSQVFELLEFKSF